MACIHAMVKPQFSVRAGEGCIAHLLVFIAGRHMLVFTLCNLMVI